MGTRETESLLKKKTFVLYCEQENRKKKVSVTENGLQFPMRGDLLLLSYASMTEVKSHRMWPFLCGSEDFIYIGVSSGRYYHFSGKNSCPLEKAISEELPEIETLL